MLKKQDTPSKSSAPKLNVAAFFCVARQEITHRIEAETLSVEPQMRNRFWSILEFWEREMGTTSGAVTGLVQRALLSAAAEQIGPLRGLRVVVDRVAWASMRQSVFDGARPDPGLTRQLPTGALTACAQSDLVRGLPGLRPAVSGHGAGVSAAAHLLTG